MKYLPIILSLLFALPALGQSIWPASKVQFADTDTLEAERDRERVFTHSTLPTCNAGAKGNVFTIDNGANTSDCITGGGTDFVECGCDGTIYRPLSGGGTAVEINDLAGDGIFGISDNFIALGTGGGTAGYIEVDDCNVTTEKLNFDGTGFTCETDQTGGGGGKWNDITAPDGNLVLDMGAFVTRFDSAHSGSGGFDPWVFALDYTNATSANLIRHFIIRRTDSGGAHGDTDTLLFLKNLDTDDAVETGIELVSEGGKINVAIDVNDADIVNVFELQSAVLISDAELALLDGEFDVHRIAVVLVQLQ